MSSRIPAVRLGEPSEKWKPYFSSLTVDGITVWKARDVHPEREDTPIIINFKRTLLIPILTVSGVRTYIKSA